MVLTDKKVGGTWVKLDAGRELQFRWPADGRQMAFASIEDTKKSYGNKSLLRYETEHDEERYESLREAKKAAIAYALEEIRRQGYSFDSAGIPIPPSSNPHISDDECHEQDRGRLQELRRVNPMFELKRTDGSPGRAGMHQYGPASIWISGPVAGTWYATIKFRNQEKDVSAPSLPAVQLKAMDWVDAAPELKPQRRNSDDECHEQDRGRLQELRQVNPMSKVQKELYLIVQHHGEMMLSDASRDPRLRGVNFKRIMSAAEALAKKGLIFYDGDVVRRRRSNPFVPRNNPTLHWVPGTPEVKAEIARRLAGAGWRIEDRKWVKGSKEIKSKRHGEWGMYDLSDPQRGSSIAIYMQPNLPALIDQILGTSNPYVSEDEYDELNECRAASRWTAGALRNPPATKLQIPSTPSGQLVLPITLAQLKRLAAQDLAAANAIHKHGFASKEATPAVRKSNQASDRVFEQYARGFTKEDHDEAASIIYDFKRRTYELYPGLSRNAEYVLNGFAQRHQKASEEAKDLEFESSLKAYDARARAMGQRRKNPLAGDVVLIENAFDAIDAPEVSLWAFQFGAYGTTNVYVWAGAAHTALEDALEEAAAVLADEAPGHLTSEKDMTDLYKEAAKDLGVPWPIEDWDDPDVEAVREQAEADMTYTESGWLTSYEWTVNELHAGDETYAEVWEISIDKLAEDGDLDDDDVEKVNRTAKELGVNEQWEMEDD
jgi:hypothetical protein